MLRVFFASKNKVSEEMNNGVNIQRVSLKNILNDVNKLRGFKKYIQKYLLEGDEILIISFVDTYFNSLNKEDEHKNLKIIHTRLPESSEHLLIKEIVNNQTKGLDYIEEKIESLQGVLELFLFAVIR